MKDQKPEKILAKYGALLVFLGLLTGIFSAAVMTGKIPGDPHTALASHIVALLGAFPLFGAIPTIQFVRLEENSEIKIVIALIFSNYSNWIVTGVKALFKVKGIDLTGEPANDTIFIILNILVVLPLFFATGFWIYGLWRE